jgi:hypothetical protein
VNFRYLEAVEVDELVQAATRVGLLGPDSRNALLAFIDQGVVANLNLIGAPQLQLRSDLVELNRIERLADGSVPLQLWLSQASSLAAGRVEEGVFRKYQEKVTAQAAGLPPLPDPADLPEVVNNEVIVHQDDMLDFIFLGQGMVAGASVAKLLVPRFVGGMQKFDAAGRPVLYYGTGWLAARDLVVTNHHVINARSANEPAAADQDLTAQAVGTTVKFDFDSPDAAGTDVGVRRLEAWDSLTGLDFAILRLQAPMNDRVPLRLWPHRLAHTQNDYRPVNIIQHPEGKAKRVACRNNLVTATDATTVRYFTDTLAGSSGSPVFNDAWNVVALHRGSRGVSGVNFQGRTTAAVNFGTQVVAILDNLRDQHPALLAEIDLTPN